MNILKNKIITNILKKEINTKKIVPKTIFYLLGIVVFFTFWHFFGTYNAIIGFFLIHASVMLFKKDLTANPIKNIFKFSFTYVCIGIFSFIALQNVYLGLVVNFVVIFILCYAFFYNLKTSIWMPFIFIYLISLHRPITLSELPLRLIGLSFGSLIIMGSQFIINRHRARRDLKSNLKKLLKGTSTKLDCIINNKPYKDNHNDIEKYISNIVTIINDRRDNIFYLNNLDNIRLNFALYIERLNLSLNKLSLDANDKLYVNFLLDLSKLLDKFNNFIDNEKSSSTLIKDLDDFINNHSKLLGYNYSAYKIIQNMSMLRFSIVNFANKKRGEKTNIINYFKISKLSMLKDIFKLNFNFKSLRFSYAFKFALLLSLSFFVTAFFKLQYGYWVNITIFAVLRPSVESSNKLVFLRSKGTIIGVLIFVLIDLTIIHTPIRLAIFFILYYCFLLSKTYDLKIACMTPLVLTMLTLMGVNPYETSILRIIYLFIGVIIAYLAIKYFLPFNTKDALKKYTKSYYDLSKDMLSFKESDTIDANLLKELNNKLLLGKLYEDKITLNNESTNIKCVQEFMRNERVLLNNIYFLFYSLYKTPINKESLNKFICEVNSIYKDSASTSHDYNEGDLLKKLKEYIRNTFNDTTISQEKLISINFYRIILRLEKSKALIGKISSTLETSS